MKDFLKGVLIWKTYACMMFTGSVTVFWVAAYFLGWKGIPLGVLLQLLLLSVVGSLLQGVMFTERLIKSMAYPARLLLFAVTFLAVLSVFAWKGKWFPAGEFGNWLTFAVIFLAVFAVMTAGYEIYFRLAGKKYDGLLGERQRGDDK